MTTLHPKEEAIIRFLSYNNKLTKEQIDIMTYTIQHKRAVLQVYISLQARIGEDLDMAFLDRLFYHDTDKLYLYSMMDKPRASKLHKNYSIHHEKNWQMGTRPELNILEALVDYESARFTKFDKQMNAYKTILTLRSWTMPLFEGYLKKYGIYSPENVDLDLWELGTRIENDYIDSNIIALDLILERKNVIENLEWFNSNILRLC